jgi:hypothetical protein
MPRFDDMDQKLRPERRTGMAEFTSTQNSAGQAAQAPYRWYSRFPKSEQLVSGELRNLADSRRPPGVSVIVRRAADTMFAKTGTFSARSRYAPTGINPKTKRGRGYAAVPMPAGVVSV